MSSTGRAGLDALPPRAREGKEERPPPPIVDEAPRGSTSKQYEEGFESDDDEDGIPVRIKSHHRRQSNQSVDQKRQLNGKKLNTRSSDASAPSARSSANLGLNSLPTSHETLAVPTSKLPKGASSPQLFPRMPVQRFLPPSLSSPAMLHNFLTPARDEGGARNSQEDVFVQLRFEISCQNLGKCSPIVGMFLKSGENRRLLCHTEWKQKETEHTFSVKLSIEFRRDVPLTVVFGVYQSGRASLSPWVDHKIVPSDLIGETSLELAPISTPVTKVLSLENSTNAKLDKQLKTKGATITLEMSRMDKESVCDWSVQGGLNGTYKYPLSDGFWDENSFMIQPLDAVESEETWTLP